MGRPRVPAAPTLLLPIAAVAALLVLGVGPAQAKTTFVQDQRVNSLTLEYGTDSFATHNAFGGAIVGSQAQSAINTAITSGVGDGSISWMFEMLGLTDLSGTNDASFSLGVLNPSPVEPQGNSASYNGASDLDWWYLPDPSQLNQDGSPKQQLPASFSASKLTAGPGNVNLNIGFAGSALTLALSGTEIQAMAGASSAPLESSNGFPPGHLPSEHLDPALESFGSMTQGKLSGNLSARSLYNTLIPSAFLGSNCNNFYAAGDTVLDVIISGCKAYGVLAEVNSTQPDAVTSAGSGTYVFTPDSNHKVVSCTHNGVADTLADCLDGAAFSIYLQFTTDRVINQSQMADGKVLTVRIAGPGDGTAVSSPDGEINCDIGEAHCSAPYDAGTKVTLTATPIGNSEFAGWIGCDNAKGKSCTMTMDSDKSLEAVFLITPPVQCRVPNVKGKTIGAAKKALQHANCAAGKIQKEHSTKVKAGHVISQNPAPSKKNRAPGTKVDLDVSSGPKR